MAQNTISDCVMIRKRPATQTLISIALNQKVFKHLKLNYNYENNDEPKRNIL